MTLRTSFGSTRSNALVAAKTAGEQLIVTQRTSIETQMTNFALQGKDAFTITLDIGYQPSDIRLGGDLWEAFMSGIYSELISEDVMIAECDVVLNTSDLQLTRVDLKFSF